MRGLVPKFIMLICLLHINFRPFDPCERVLTDTSLVIVTKAHGDHKTIHICHEIVYFFVIIVCV